MTLKVKKGDLLWLSRYALSMGIKEVSAKDDLEADDNYVQLDGHWSGYRLGMDVHVTREGAVKAAESARVKKIASVKKQLAKLEKLSFAA